MDDSVYWGLCNLASYITHIQALNDETNNYHSPLLKKPVCLYVYEDTMSVVSR